MFDTINSVNLADFEQFIFIWVIINLVTGLPIFISKMMPISGRSEKTWLSILGDINKKAAWIIMEIPVLIVVLTFYFLGSNPINASIVMIAAFCMHYTNRALIYPYRIKADGKTMPVMMMLFSMIFYIVNGYIIGHYFGALKTYTIEWLYDPRFIIGLIMFLGGFILNITSDNILLNLRKPGETGYKIPQGGMFKYVSCPHYLGEMIEWAGFAIMTWSLPGLAYAIIVVVPLFGQARNAHQWYLDKFGDEYPKNRKAIFPGLI
jgi:protein-S-isoprenylcysteine O-methyltransferase Ste14